MNDYTVSKGGRVRQVKRTQTQGRIEQLVLWAAKRVYSEHPGTLARALAIQELDSAVRRLIEYESRGDRK